MSYQQVPTTDGAYQTPAIYPPPSGSPQQQQQQPPYLTQQPYPNQQPYSPQPYATGVTPQYNGVPPQVGGQPHAHTTVIVDGYNRCPHCQVGVMNDEFTCCGIVCAILFFPIGLLCCLLMKEHRCGSCGYTRPT